MEVIFDEVCFTYNENTPFSKDALNWCIESILDSGLCQIQDMNNDEILTKIRIQKTPYTDVFFQTVFERLEYERSDHPIHRIIKFWNDETLMFTRNIEMKQYILFF